MAKNMEKTNFNKSEVYDFALTWGDVKGRKYRQEILDLANHIAQVKPGSSRECIPFGPEYCIFEPVLDEFQANVALKLKFREKQSAKDIATPMNAPVDKVAEALEYLAWAGFCFVNNVKGVDVYWIDIFVPGHMEMVVNNKELVAKYPQIGEAFYYFGRKKRTNGGRYYGNWW